MNTYEKETIGNIVLIRNLVFQNQVLDHSWKNGRPCIIIYSDEEYDYFLPIKSLIVDEKYKDNYIPINERDLLYKSVNMFGKHHRQKFSKIETKGYINLETIYKTPISWHDEIGKVKFKTYKHIINSLKKHFKQEDLNQLLKAANIIKGR